MTVDILQLGFFDENITRLQGAGWAIKPFAILASSFQQVMIADSDVVFLQNPETVFDHPGYVDTGTLFFHDRVISGGHEIHRWWQGIMHNREPSAMLNHSKFWAEETIHEMESGLVVFNKGNKKVMLGLLLAAWMNTDAVRTATTYTHTYGKALGVMG